MPADCVPLTNEPKQKTLICIDGLEFTRTEHPGALPYEKVRDASRKFLIKAKESRLGVA